MAAKRESLMKLWFSVRTTLLSRHFYKRLLGRPNTQSNLRFKVIMVMHVHASLMSCHIYYKQCTLRWLHLIIGKVLTYLIPKASAQLMMAALILDRKRISCLQFSIPSLFSRWQGKQEKNDCSKNTWVLSRNQILDFESGTWRWWVHHTAENISIGS